MLNRQAQQLFAEGKDERATVTTWADRIHSQDRFIFTTVLTWCRFSSFPRRRREDVPLLVRDFLQHH